MTRACTVWLAAVLLASSALPSAAQETAASDGEVLFNNACRTCHTTNDGDNRLGPNLAKTIGRKAGSLPDYAYSESMKKAELTWDEGTLDRFIENPDAVVPGNNMKPYTGMTSAEDRKTIIAFLKSK